MKDETIQRIANYTTIATGVIATVNFLYSMVHGSSGEVLTIPSTPGITLPFRIILLLFLETALGYAFGWSLVSLERRGKGLPILGVWAVSLISAWTSLFNVQWVLTGPTPSEYEFGSVFTFWFALSGVLAYVIATYLIDTHVHKQAQVEGWKMISFGESLSPFSLAACFFVMFFVFLYGS